MPLEVVLASCQETKRKMKTQTLKKDWTGNKATAFSQIGTIYETKQTDPNRGVDYYASPPQALRDLLKYESFENVWECADGAGHLCQVLKENGILGKHSDLIDRGCGERGIDFLDINGICQWPGDIITNPPYRYAQSFVEKALEIVFTGRKVAMLLKIQFLEGKNRQRLFKANPPKTIYVWPGRITCALNGKFEDIKHGSPMMFGWFVWEKGFRGDPIIKWFNLQSIPDSLF